MSDSLTVLQVAGLVVACMVGGAALLTLLLAGIGSACNQDHPGDEMGCGCGAIGGLLLVAALALAIWALAAA